MLEQLVISAKYNHCVLKNYKGKKKSVADHFRGTVLRSDTWTKLETFVDVTLPMMQVLRLADQRFVLPA